MMTATLTLCTAADVEQLSLVSAQSFIDAFGDTNSESDLQQFIQEAYSPEVLTQEMVNPQSDFYFLRSDGKTVGYLKLNWGGAQTEPMGDDALEVERIYLLGASTGQGFGSVMMKHALEEARRRQCKTIWLGVWEHNLAAQKFYRSHGFSPFSSHTFMLGEDKQLDILMKKDLT